MNLMSQTAAGKAVGINQSQVGRYLAKGKLKRYGKKVDVDELKQLLEDNEPNRIDKELIKKEAQKESSNQSTASQTKTQMTYSAARTHKEAFNAKLAEVAYKQKIGELISIEKAKGVVDVMFNPLSRKLDDLHIDLKSRFPDIQMEAIDWLSEYINDIKKSVENYKW